MARGKQSNPKRALQNNAISSHSAPAGLELKAQMLGFTLREECISGRPESRPDPDREETRIGPQRLCH